jgi:hypothetical protein
MTTDSVVAKHPDRWVVSMADAVVSRCSFDWAVSWLIATGGGEVEIRVEQPFLFGVSEMVRLVPDGPPPQLAPVLTTLRDSVVRVEAFADGRLEVEFGSGAVATVEPSDEFEAWSLAGPGGAKLVSKPGGGVTAWSTAP